MRFGKSAQEAAQEPGRGGGGNFIKYLKDGDNTMRILQEPDEWLYYWEHFSPAGFSFPCPRGKDDPIEDCPGCSSNNEKMKKVSRKIAFNILHSFNGTEYVDAFKIGPMVSEKLENRYKRFATITDRDYTITKYETAQKRTDFDVEGHEPTPVDLHKSEWKDIEALLAASYEEHWGDPNQAAANLQASETTEAPPKRPTIAPQPRPGTVQRADVPVQPEEPPFEPEKVYQEADLRAMDPEVLRKLIVAEMKVTPPATLSTADELVDWLMNVS